jgi:hypothetical protein
MNRLRVSNLGVMGIVMVTGHMLALKLLITSAKAGWILLNTRNSSTIVGADSRVRDDAGTCHG